MGELAIKSSWITHLGYNEKTHQLYIKSRGRIYRYNNVPWSVLKEFVLSESAGSAWKRLIKGKFKEIK